MIVKIISNKTQFITSMESVQLNEMLSLLTQMPGKYSIVVECENDGQFRDPNNIIHRNFKSSFVPVPEPVVKKNDVKNTCKDLKPGQ